MIPLSKRINIALKLELKSKIKNDGKNTRNAIIFFIILICKAENHLVCCLHKKQAYVQELAANKAEIMPNKP